MLNNVSSNKNIQNIEDVISEIEKMNKQIKELKFQISQKEDDIKNIISEKDIIITKLNNKIIEQEKMILENKNEIINLNNKINKINDNISNEIKNIQTENKEGLNKLNNNIINKRQKLLNKMYNIYINNFDNKNNNIINKKNILSNQTYKVIIIGQCGVGKTQFCGFAKKNQQNIKRISPSNEDVKSHFFTRLGINFEFIDFPGFTDYHDESVFYSKLRKYLASRDTIDYIILLFNFHNVRFERSAREIFEYLNKIFSPARFWSHFCIGFTHFYEEEEEYKEELILMYNEIIMEIFNPNKNIQLPDIQTFREKKNCYDEESQKNLDIMLKQIKSDVDIYGPIHIANITKSEYNAEYLNEQKLVEILKIKCQEDEIKKFKKKECSIQ